MTWVKVLVYKLKLELVIRVGLGACYLKFSKLCRPINEEGLTNVEC